MRARFIGDPNDDFSGPDVVIVLETKFPIDEWVNVEAAVAHKLETHSHFEVDYGDLVLATDGSPVTDLPKRRGWPKGKPRGPRVSHEPPPAEAEDVLIEPLEDEDNAEEQS